MTLCVSSAARWPVWWWARLRALPRCRLPLGLALCAAALSACAPDLGPAPKLSQPAAYASDKSFAAPQTVWPALDWWTAYGDAELDRLETEALAGAPDLRAARARVGAALATLEQAHADLLPQFSGDASIQTSKQSINQGFPQAFESFEPHGYHTETRIAADLDWQLDFFGRNRAALAAATSQAQATQADQAAAGLQITTAVADAYADLVRLYADRDAAADALRCASRPWTWSAGASATGWRRLERSASRRRPCPRPGATWTPSTARS